ncbi:MAG: isocitrate/isopropylmalate dehydrogenase family protein [Anaerolineae bacterium]|nr:isocitrate/isopropylmalate dehydrogenase family protein [Anaerolineae bacterium]
MRRQVCVIEGDGIGREVIPPAVEVLCAVLDGVEVVSAEAGWECFQRRGGSVPPQTLEAVRACGAALFGAVSSPARKVEGYRSAILTLRQELDLYANLRPVRGVFAQPPAAQVDMIIVRENSEGLYAGRERREGDTAIAERVITLAASRRIGRRAVEMLTRRGAGRLTIVHKANILPLTDGLFRQGVMEAVEEARRGGQAVEVEEMLVDNAAYQLAVDAGRFAVLVTTNLFGDILSDVAARWCGGMGLAPSLNLGDDCAVAEPVHGSAPDIAGRGIANPAAAMLSAALLARYVWKEEDAARRIELAVQLALQTPGENTTAAITRRVLAALETNAMTGGMQV